MAFIGPMLGVIGGLGMLFNLGKSGVDAQIHAADIRNQIQQVTDKNKSIQEQYAELAKGVVDNEEAIAGQIQSLNDEYNLISSKLRASQANFATSFKKIQLVGIIFIIVVFALLLLKQFGLLDVIIHYLDLPFVLLWHAITGKGGDKKSASS